LFERETQSVPLQGYLGDCWFISACHAIQQLHVVTKLFTSTPNFKSEQVNFITVRIYVPQSGPVEIKVDEFLPTINGKLIFASCSQQNQLWCAYVEKACAKYFGCYEALTGGQVSEGFSMLTNRYPLRRRHNGLSENEQFFSCLRRILRDPSCAASVTFHKRGGLQGIVVGHFYTLKENCNGNTFEVKMINLQRSHCSSLRSPVVVVSLESLEKEEFTVTYMMLGLKAWPADSCSPHSNAASHVCQASWAAFKSCGGKYDKTSASFHRNPQFLLSVNEQSLVHITLHQESTRKYSRGKFLQQAIGVHVWEASSLEPRKFSEGLLKKNRVSKCSMPEYEHSSEVSILFRSDKSSRQLLIIPSTYDLNVTISFTLRVTTSNKSSIVQLT